MDLGMGFRWFFYALVFGVLGPFMGLTSSHRLLAEEKVPGVLQLGDRVSEAVCDFDRISRAPSLVSTRGALSSSRGKVFRVMVPLRAPLKEHTGVAFLLGDVQTVLALPELLRQWHQAKGKKAQELRRQVSLEVCTAQARGQQVFRLLKRKPDLFLPLQLMNGGRGQKVDSSSVAAGAGPAFHLEIFDPDNRMGYLNGTWYLAGWIQPREVLSLTMGGRRYRRLFHPVTRELRWVVLQGQDGELQGFFHSMSSGAPPRGESDAHGSARFQVIRKKRMESYQILMEEAAHRALVLSPQRSSVIRNLHDEYRHLIRSYEVHPQDRRFARYENQKKAIPLQDLSRDHSFQKLLKSIRVNGKPTGFTPFEPSGALLGIFQEYLGRLDTASP